MSIGPVSYTHLDVYKRQLFIFFRKFPDFFLYLAEQLFIYNPFVGILCIDPLTLRSVSLLISLENALLILDVYKRQVCHPH